MVKIYKPRSNLI